MPIVLVWQGKYYENHVHFNVTLLLHLRRGETCSHIAAILFKVEAFIRLELGKESCTSLPCAWNQAFTKNVSNFVVMCFHYFYS